MSLSTVEFDWSVFLFLFFRDGTNNLNLAEHNRIQKSGKPKATLMIPFSGKFGVLLKECKCVSERIVFN